jgi:hypothetical protein
VLKVLRVVEVGLAVEVGLRVAFVETMERLWSGVCGTIDRRREGAEATRRESRSMVVAVGRAAMVGGMMVVVVMGMEETRDANFLNGWRRGAELGKEMTFCRPSTPNLVELLSHQITRKAGNIRREDSFIYIYSR